LEEIDVCVTTGSDKILDITFHPPRRGTSRGTEANPALTGSKTRRSVHRAPNQPRRLWDNATLATPPDPAVRAQWREDRRTGTTTEKESSQEQQRLYARGPDPEGSHSREEAAVKCWGLTKIRPNTGSGGVHTHGFYGHPGK
jgi:hypothetical protein